MKIINQLLIIGSCFLLHSCGTGMSDADLKALEQSNIAKAKYNDSMAVVMANYDYKESVKKLSPKARKIHNKHPKWGVEACELLAKKRIWIGMHYDMVIYLRGLPNDVNTSNYGSGNQYQSCWDDYDPSCFYFNEDMIIKSYN